MKRSALLLLSIALTASPATAIQSGARTDAEVRQRIIRESIAGYPGSCPCPYSISRQGEKCERKSSHSRGDMFKLKCFAADVSDDDVLQWRKANPQP